MASFSGYILSTTGVRVPASAVLGERLAESREGVLGDRVEQDVVALITLCEVILSVGGDMVGTDRSDRLSVPAAAQYTVTRQARPGYGRRSGGY
jgi:hypothetical protein